MPRCLPKNLQNRKFFVIFIGVCVSLCVSVIFMYIHMSNVYLNVCLTVAYDSQSHIDLYQVYAPSSTRAKNRKNNIYLFAH